MMFHRHYNYLEDKEGVGGYIMGIRFTSGGSHKKTCIISHRNWSVFNSFHMITTLKIVLLVKLNRLWKIWSD